MSHWVWPSRKTWWSKVIILSPQLQIFHEEKYQRRKPMSREIWILSNIWEDFIPNKQTWEISNWQIISGRINGKLRVCLKQTFWVLIDRLLLAAVKSGLNVEETRVPRRSSDETFSEQGTVWSAKGLWRKWKTGRSGRDLSFVLQAGVVVRTMKELTIFRTFNKENYSDFLWRHYISLWTKSHGK